METVASQQLVCAVDENAELFAAVLAILDQKELSALVSAVLTKLGQHVKGDLLVGEPVYGSYHILFPLKAQSDPNPGWLIKIPINGAPSKWDHLSAKALSSEANTMRLLRRETTIPIPNVLDFSPTTDNPISCPYILMTYVEGKPLYDVWFGHRLQGLNEATICQHRTRALQDISSAMAQLGRYSFPKSGSPMFGYDGKLIPSTTQPSRRIDHKTILDRWFIHNDPDDQPIYVELPTSDNPKSYYNFMANHHPEQNPVPRGISKLLLQFIDWIPEPTADYPFVLSHPDFDIQNFIVSEKGELRAIIDWDGIAATPRTLGNERYPGWLTRDWDPSMYGYQESMERGIEPDGLWEDSPSTLSRYRNIYAQMMSQHCEATEASKLKKPLPRLSLITENLAIAANDPSCRRPIMQKLLDETWAVLGREDGGKLDLTQLALLFDENKLEVEILQALHKGFLSLLSEEGL